MRKLKSKMLNNHPELGHLLKSIDDKKVMLKTLKQQKNSLKLEIKSDEKSFIKQAKHLQKTKKIKATQSNQNVDATSFPAVNTKTSSKKRAASSAA